MKNKGLRIIGLFLGFVILVIAGGLIYVKTALPNVGPAPELKVEMTAAQIERGQYIANHVALCMDCHSQRDYSKFAAPPVMSTFGSGGEKFGPEMGFPGTFYSKNITPYALKDWTDGEIYRAITAGVSKSGKALFPVMPYHNFGQMDDRDVHAVIAYLRTIPAIKSDIPESKADFPMNIILQTMPAKGIPVIRPDEKDVLAYGKYLTTFAGCGECHTKKEQGKPLPGMELAGGMEFQLPNGMLRSANITPDTETGIGNWTEEAFVKRFKMYADSAYQVPTVGKEDFNTIMPWMMYAGMKETDLKAIYAYLKTLQPVQNKVVRFEPRSEKSIASM